MTQDEIIEIANDMAFMASIWIEDDSNEFKDMIAFAKLVAAKEREACAKVCDDYIVKWQRAGFRGDLTTATDLSNAIRARSISRGEA